VITINLQNYVTGEKRRKILQREKLQAWENIEPIASAGTRHN